MEGNALIEKNTYTFTFSYTETIEGQLHAETVEQAKEILNGQFGHAPGYTVVNIELGAMTVEPDDQMELDLKVIN